MASFHVVADSFWQNVWGAADFDTALTNDSNDKIKNYTTSGFVGEKDNKSSFKPAFEKEWKPRRQTVFFWKKEDP